MLEAYNFLITGDKHYVNQMVVTATSVIANMGGKKLNFHFFTGDMRNEDYDTLRLIEDSNCSVNIYPMEKYEHYFDNVIPEKSHNPHVSKAGNYRLLMTEVLPMTVKKCMYLDCDIIVDANIESIYNELKENELAAVVSEIAAMEYRESMLKHWYTWKEFSNFVKDPLKYPHFNDGLFILNVELARKVHLFDYILTFISNHDYIPYTDQDILNAALGQGHLGPIRYLPPEYNVFWDTDHYRCFTRSYYPSDQITNAFKNPKIIHFCGSWKPWDYGGWHHYDIWWKYALQSPVSDFFTKNNGENIAKMVHEGIIYHRGWDVEKDLNYSLKCLLNAIESGASKAVVEALDVCKETRKWDVFNKLYQYAEKEACHGNGGSAVRLAQAYRYGQGLEKNLSLAIKWYRRAIVCKINWCKPELFDTINEMIEELSKKMFMVSQEGSKDGNAMSMIQLGRCYRDGIGIAVEPNMALYYFERGVEEGADWAIPELDHIKMCVRGHPFWKN